MEFRKSIILAKKELFTLSNSPAFYGICLFFTVFCSVWLFYLNSFFAMNQANLRMYFGAFPIVFILVIPVITMKSWAEERKLGSIELLLTMPFSEWELVLGKFFASFGAVLILLLISLPVPLSILPLGNFDLGVLFCEYVGVILLGSSATALGLLLSCLSKNQAGAFLGSATALLFTMLANQLTIALSLPSFMAEGINFFSLSFHFDSFSKGIIDSRDLAFFTISTAMFLFLNTRVIIFRKWS